MYGERSRAQMREAHSGSPRFSIFYCGCKQPKSVHMLFLRLQRYEDFPNLHNFSPFFFAHIEEITNFAPCFVRGTTISYFE